MTGPLLAWTQKFAVQHFTLKVQNLFTKATIFTSVFRLLLVMLVTHILRIFDFLAYLCFMFTIYSLGLAVNSVHPHQNNNNGTLYGTLLEIPVTVPFCKGSIHTELLAIALALADVAKTGYSTYFLVTLTLLVRAQCERILTSVTHLLFLLDTHNQSRVIKWQGLMNIWTDKSIHCNLSRHHDRRKQWTRPP